MNDLTKIVEEGLEELKLAKIEFDIAIINAQESSERAIVMLSALTDMITQNNCQGGLTDEEQIAKDAMVEGEVDDMIMEEKEEEVI